MKKHFVKFYSPGTIVSEETSKEIDSWDVEKAKSMARSVMERYGATPYAFQFQTWERNEDEMNSHLSAFSCLYYLGGKVRTAEEILAGTDSNEEILRKNVENNNIERVIENTNSWKVTRPLEKDDVVLDWIL